MKVLLDECAPRALKHALAAHGYECLTLQEVGWSGKANGELLDLAEAEFDVLVTLDTNLKYQQNLAGRKIAILVLRARSNRPTYLSPLFPACVKALHAINPGEIVYVGSAV
jgi:predicted nuclease of predicted toxin-antitoxin system